MEYRRLNKYGYYFKLNYDKGCSSYIEYGLDGLNAIFKHICLSSLPYQSVNHFAFISTVLKLIKDGKSEFYDPIKDINYSFEIVNYKDCPLIKSIDDYEYYMHALYAYIHEQDFILMKKRQNDRLSREEGYRKGV